MTNPLMEMSAAQIDLLVGALDSLKDGDLAVDMLVACGARAIPSLTLYLLKGSPRTISLPRCRAARALGELGAYSELLSYLRDYKRPQDAAVMFSEDSVRSAVAHHLMHWKCDETFRVLLDATKQRATGGLVQALGEFRRSESIPLMFDLLGDDLCRAPAMESLLKIPNDARQFGLLTIRGVIDVKLNVHSALVRRRATLQLLAMLGVGVTDWEDLYGILRESDPGTVLAVAQIGFQVAPESSYPRIVTALLRIADTLNWVQESDILQLLDQHLSVARDIALRVRSAEREQQPKWISPRSRILQHILGKELE
jgi:hypothetical protein